MIPRHALAHPETDHGEGGARGAWRKTLRVVRGVYERYAGDNVSLYAAGVALFGLTAVPATASAIASIYGLATDNEALWSHVAWMARTLPQDVALFLEGVVTTAVQTSPDRLSLGAVGSVLLALVSAQQSATGVMAGMNQIARRPENRSFLRRQAVGLVLAVLWVTSTVAALFALAALPRLLDSGVFGHLTDELRVAVLVLRWPVTLALLTAELAVVYRHGPCAACLPWPSVWRGAAVGAVLWALVSIAVSVAVGTLIDYGRYGAAGGLLVILLWANASALSLFLGALVAIVHAEDAATSEALVADGARALAKAEADRAPRAGDAPRLDVPRLAPASRP